MQPVTAILLVVAIIAVVITAGCTTTVYPTQTVTVTEKFVKNPTSYDWSEQHYVIDQDGLALKVFSSNPSQEAAMYTSMQKGHTYICEIYRCNDGSNHYCIMEIIQEV